jgi:sugar lactone lactonase YvrE
MSVQLPPATSGNFEDDLLAALLAVHDELNRANGSSLKNHARYPARRPARARPVPSFSRPRGYPYSTGPAERPRDGGARRAMLATVGVAAVLVAATILFVSVRSDRQRVRVLPSASSTSARGTATTGHETGAAIGAGALPATAATVHQTMFIANWDSSTVSSFAVPGKGTEAPLTTITGTDEPQGIAFDRSGDMWVGTAGSINEYTKSQLTKSGALKPKVSIPGDTFAALAFDSVGDLWAAGYGTSTVYEYAKSELTKPDPTPMLKISSTSLQTPVGIAIDTLGNLWVSNEASGKVVEFTNSQIPKEGVVNLTPKVQFVPGAGGLDNSEEITFDSSGNLWVAAGDGGYVVEYPKDQLTKPSPIHALALPAGNPTGVAFDSSGNLWVVDWSDSTVSEYANGQLRSPSPQPHTELTTGVNGPMAVAFEP